MRTIYIELKTKNTPKLIDGSIKQGNTYIIFVSSEFDVKDQGDLESLVEELNYQLRIDKIEPVDFRSVEKELERLSVGSRVDVRI